MERELRPPRFGFFPPASLSDSSLRPQRAEKAPVFATHALRRKARPVYFGGRLEVWLVILRRNLRRDFGVPCQILWVSCAVCFSSAKQALHVSLHRAASDSVEPCTPDSASAAPAVAARTGSSSARWWCVASLALSVSATRACFLRCSARCFETSAGDSGACSAFALLRPPRIGKTLCASTHSPKPCPVRTHGRLDPEFDIVERKTQTLTSAVVTLAVRHHSTPCCFFSAIFARSQAAYSPFV